jgi:hypothetical protein
MVPPIVVPFCHVIVARITMYPGIALDGGPFWHLLVAGIPL